MSFTDSRKRVNTTQQEVSKAKRACFKKQETIEKWRFFPLEVKEMVIENMNLIERYSLAQCSKRTFRLVTRVPIHFRRAEVMQGSKIEGYMLLTHNNILVKMTVNDFLAFMTPRKSTIDKFEATLENNWDVFTARQLVENVKRTKPLRVKTLILSAGSTEAIENILQSCDSKYLETLEIPKCKENIFEKISKTEQWKNCEVVNVAPVLFNFKIEYFLNFEQFHVKVNRLTSDWALDIVKAFQSKKDPIGFFSVKMLQPMTPYETKKFFDSLGPSWLNPLKNDCFVRCLVVPGNDDVMLHIEYHIEYQNCMFLGGYMPISMLAKVYGNQVRPDWFL